MFIGAGAVRRIEKSTGKKIMELMQDGEALASMEMIHLFIKNGMGADTN